MGYTLSDDPFFFFEEEEEDADENKYLSFSFGTLAPATFPDDTALSFSQNIRT